MFFHADIYLMAAAYLYHIILNHPFLDGNKRTGVLAARVFLELNGISLKHRSLELAALAQEVARGESSKARIARTFRKWGKAAATPRSRRSRH